MIFQHLDTVIAFSVIMLLLSLVITAAVQIVVSIAGLRGRTLLWGIGQLPREIDPNLEPSAQDLARRVLSHPVIATSTNRLLQCVDWLRRKQGKPPRFNNGKRAPTAVQPKEVLLILDRVRSEENLGDDVKKTLDSLFDTRVVAPSADLPGAEELVSKLKERLGGQGERLVEQTVGKIRKVDAKFRDWFDVVMDACSEKSKLWTRWISVAGAAILAFGFHVDAGRIYRQLAMSPELRATILEQMEDVERLHARLQPAAADAEELKATVGDIRNRLEQTELRLFSSDRASFSWGEVMTLVLLSLGAPFWCRALRNLVGFRSIVTRRQEQGQAAAKYAPESG